MIPKEKKIHRRTFFFYLDNGTNDRSANDYLAV